MALGVTTSATATATASSSTVAPITIAVSGPYVDFSDVFIAQAAGLFKKAGVSVKLIEDTGANTLDDVVSGTADIGVYTAPIALEAAEQGKPISVIYAVERDPGAALLTESSINSIAALKAKSGCRIAVSTSGSQGYAYGGIYKSKLGLSNCQLVQVSLPSLALGGLKSGSYNAMVTTYSNGELGVSQGDHMIINPLSKAERAKYAVPPYPTAVLFGPTADLKSKSSAVTRVLQAVDEAASMEGTISNAKWGDYLKAASPGDFKTVQPSLLTSEIQAIRPFIGPGTVPTMTPQLGYISPQLWKTALNEYKKWGITGFSPTASVNSYKERVDMTYLNNRD